MAADAAAAPAPKPPPPLPEDSQLPTYLGVSFALFLATLPASTGARHVASLQSRGRILAARLLASEDQLRQLRARRREDARANARAAEIFAGHRAAWMEAERRLLARAAAAGDEAASLRARLADAEANAAALRARVERLEREAAERDGLLTALLAATSRAGEGEGERVLGDEREEHQDQDPDPVPVPPLDPPEATDAEALAAAAALYAQQRQKHDGYGDDFYTAATAPSGMPPWMDPSKGWQDLKYDTVESTHNTKHVVPRRESPWKVDVESSGVPAKLRLLEQELINLEKVVNGDLSKIPLAMRKQVKRYQTLAGKIDDLCKRMQTSDPCDSTLSSEFRTQRQTEFLLEAFHLQHRATETRQKLSTLQAETAKSSFGDELTAEAKMCTRRALSSIRNNFKEIQRSLEIWLARILGDLEGMLARDGASRIREYFLSPYASAVR
ncbi:uncharacterized protein LOC120687398 isoform X2 [Panicum virgatum]|uniref:Uncharacterized protein n=1 Tax=Panicum virgatum TaxID=38727 RepID=A0A8T0MET1_PANVG|nr:uncharacterized protein LOC120687398 isoform X2 [Panicum virgatum]KAG2533779.1 hypothetical protein PVAP13_9NG013600 [Panicum virgatum]